MATNNNSFQDTIKAYLDKRAAEDSLFAVTYAKENKNIKDCCSYITSQAKKQASNGCAMIEDSLIFSARIRGKRIETVEVSLKQLKVVQCRGLQNSNTEYHDRIISLVTKNMHLIKERLKAKKNGTKKDVNRIPQGVDMAV
ncbi:Cas9 inhibitor AcrIIA9 family protein [uncultured Dysgonomonas sp.]|uniref:PcfJ-like protein n=1 Tax=uncultured Dysgonomonas sp. TaxID=206096 RepID=A0A212K1Q2_9BACT|nr:Cas9 inhibitor AcrIIA9 family protein [uncultured Dysgonomonas sp.]SBW05631.1 hypothetical protein KL86DYS1_31161 [uncultured Dysgonomonas sp.]